MARSHPVTIHHRTDYASSMIDGRTVMDFEPNGKSAQEIIQLWTYIADRLERNFRRTVFSPAQGQYQGMERRQVQNGGFGRRVAS